MLPHFRDLSDEFHLCIAQNTKEGNRFQQLIKTPLLKIFPSFSIKKKVYFFKQETQVLLRCSCLPSKFQVLFLYPLTCGQQELVMLGILKIPVRAELFLGRRTAVIVSSRVEKKPGEAGSFDCALISLLSWVKKKCLCDQMTFPYF